MADELHQARGMLAIACDEARGGGFGSSDIRNLCAVPMSLQAGVTIRDCDGAVALGIPDAEVHYGLTMPVAVQTAGRAGVVVGNRHAVQILERKIGWSVADALGRSVIETMSRPAAPRGPQSGRTASHSP